jgi:hypothetical protein
VPTLQSIYPHLFMTKQRYIESLARGHIWGSGLAPLCRNMREHDILPFRNNLREWLYLRGEVVMEAHVEAFKSGTHLQRAQCNNQSRPVPGDQRYMQLLLGFDEIGATGATAGS